MTRPLAFSFAAGNGERVEAILTKEKTTGDGPTPAANDEEWPGIDSRYRLIVVAAQRAKQLLHGSRPRVEVDPLKRRNTSIALEEVRRGLVPFSRTDKGAQESGEGDDH